MKKLKKNLFGIGMAFSMMLGVAFSFVPQDASAQMLDKWKSTTIKCTVTTTLTVGGGPIPVSYSTSTTYKGTMRKCVSGGGFCVWNSDCS